MPRTIGIEEEFLVFDADAPTLAGVGGLVAERVDDGSDGQFEHELKRQQVELGTAPHEHLDELSRELRDRRAELGRGAAAKTARIVAAATSPVPGASTTTPDERYARMQDAFGETARTALSCGMHVHVGLRSSDEGAGVLTALRAWLPTVLALSANSPFHGGRDTGYQSYRNVLWQQWPTAGMFGEFRDAADYDATVAALQETGAAMDAGMIYFDARLSASYPTVEIRAADVCPDIDDAATLAALCRALVDAGAAGALPVPSGVTARVEVLRGAMWRAARYGMSDTLCDPVSTRQVAAWDVVDGLMTQLSGAPDADRIRAGLADIRRRGTGSALQRAVHTATGELGAVVDALADRTLA